MAETIHIKNMVCPRCIASVEGILCELGIDHQSVSLGQVVLTTVLHDKSQLSERLEENGFELLLDHRSKLIDQIKTIVIDHVHHSDERLKSNFSNYLVERLHQEYGLLSRLFSSVEGITIEKYILKQRIEKVKELILYDQMTLSQIAHKMNYSSVAHLSSQFKKETGMTPSEFKKLQFSGRKSIDSI